MRDASLKQNLLRGVSLASVHVASSVSPMHEATPPLEYRASGFLARIGLWVRFIFGLGAPRCESVSLAQEDYAASRVQTLNQYRERFARISVLGRVGIYAPPSFGRFAQLILSSRAA